MLDVLKENIQQFLEENNVKYQIIENSDTFEVSYTTENETLKKPEILISMTNDCIVFYEFLFLDNELYDKGEFLRMLNKVNLNIGIGKFVYNNKTNGIEYSSYITCCDKVPTFEMIEDSFNAVKRLMIKFSTVMKNAAEGKYLTQEAFDELLISESNDGVVY